MADRSPLPFPCDLAGLLPAGVADSLSAIELGAMYRLLSAAWAGPTFGHPPGCLSADPLVLARLARLTPAEWVQVEPVVRLVFHPTEGGRIVCPALADLWSRADAKRRQCLEAASAAGRASAAARSGVVNRSVNRTVNRSVDRSVQTGLAGQNPPFDGGLARTRAERSALKTERNTSGAPESQQPVGCDGSGERGEIVASLGRRAQELTEIRVAEWRRGQVLGMLREAVARWANAGLTTLPAAKVTELASSPAATPERVQAAIEAADDCLRDAAATKGHCRPVGVLITRLGATRVPRRPMDAPLQLVQAWARREAAARLEFEPAAARLARSEQQSIEQGRARLEAIRAQLGVAQKGTGS